MGHMKTGVRMNLASGSLDWKATSLHHFAHFPVQWEHNSKLVFKLNDFDWLFTYYKSMWSSLQKNLKIQIKKKNLNVHNLIPQVEPVNTKCFQIFFLSTYT